VSTLTSTTEELREQAITALRKGQQATLDAVKNIVEAVSSVTTRLPSGPAGLKVPFADRLPAPEAVVAGAYDFAGQLLAEQRKFTDEIVKATAALRPGAARTTTGQAADTTGQAPAAGDGEPAA
jgi:hypothetical protein